MKFGGSGFEAEYNEALDSWKYEKWEPQKDGTNDNVVRIYVDGWNGDDWPTDVEQFATPAEHRRGYREWFLRRLAGPREWVEEATRARSPGDIGGFAMQAAMGGAALSILLASALASIAGWSEPGGLNTAPPAPPRWP